MVGRATVRGTGRITVPKAVREWLGVRPGDEIGFVETPNGYQVVKVLSDSPFEKWSGTLEHLRGADPDELIEEARGR